MERRNLTKPKVCILLSGGIDSTACIAFYLSQGFAVQAMFIDYGQTSAYREKKAAKDIARFYKISLAVFKCSGFHRKKSGLILGRNAFLLFSALMEIPENVKIIVIGVHAGTDYYDCGPDFINIMQSLFDKYTNGKIQIGAPFLKWYKQDIWIYCKSQHIPLKRTYSCENGLNQPCGKCMSCKDLEALNAIS